MQSGIPANPRYPPPTARRNMGDLSSLPSQGSSQIVSKFAPQPSPRSRPPPSPEDLRAPRRPNAPQPRNSPEPQWPLASNRDMSPRDAEPAPRGPPPQRPPRPSYVPSILDPENQRQMVSPRQDRPQQRPLQAPPDAPQQQWREDEYLSPSYSSSGNSRPLTTSSQGSEVSSLGSIPDFPVPIPQANVSQPRRSPNLGPPPSARRGPSSYYSQTSYVSPIVEESEGGRSHNSFASSTVIPAQGKDFYYDTENSPVDDEMPVSPSEDGRQSRAEDHTEHSNLVRKASLGKKAKPSLTTIKSGDNLREERSADCTPPRAQGVVAQAVLAAGAAGGAYAAGLGANREQHSRADSAPDSTLSSGTGLFDPSSSSNSSQESLPSFEKSKELGIGNSSPGTPISRSRSPLSPVDSRVATVLGGLEKGGAIDANTARTMKAPPNRQGSLADRVGTRRPPRLNVDAVREAEARGSLTSLPDLIRRATRLASNLDRGKTASRLGMDWFTDEDKKRESAMSNNRRSGSLSDILASFPPPMVGTPTSRPLSRWPSGDALGQHSGMNSRQTNRESEKPGQKRGRRCCGMPLWLFIILMTLLALLIIAAVVVPVILLVVVPNNQKHNNSNNALATCQNTLTCQNGGTVILAQGNTCSCLCANGYTGDRCQTASDAGCVTTSAAGLSSATLGSSIPRLLQSSTVFNVPLNSSQLLALFSSSNLSCTSENALVTFNGASQRKRSAPESEPEHSTTTSSSAIATITPPTNHFEPQELKPRQDQAITSNGIVMAASPTTGALASQTRSSATSTPTIVGISKNSTALDFARVGVLFVFQDSRNLNTAVNAQQQVQNLLSESSVTASDFKNVTLGSGYSIDLLGLNIATSNGTIVGSAGSK